MTVAPDIESLWSKTRPDPQGLVPCVAQDLRSRAVLMVAWVSKAALEHSLKTGYATYYSRSRKTLWEKGATSGNRQRLVHVRLDCDGDTLLYLVEARLPACHEGTDTCFSHRRVGNGWMREPEDIASGSVVESLAADFETVLDLPAQVAPAAEAAPEAPAPRAPSEASKVRIRAASEALMAALDGAPEPRIVDESADLVYQLALALKARGLGFRQVFAALETRLSPANPADPGSER